MKKQLKTTVYAVLCAGFALILQSCVEFVDADTGAPIGGGGGYAQQQPFGNQGGSMGPGGRRLDQGGQRRLDSITVDKSQTGACIAWTPNSKANRRQEIADYGSKYYAEHNRLPSEAHLTKKYGFKAMVKWVDEKDKVVGSVKVRPDEVPANIRAKFM